MAHITATAIAAIHARIDTQISPATLPYKIGAKYIRAHDRPPRVVWAEANGPIDPTKRAGGNAAEIGIGAARFEVHIWDTTLEAARISMHNIIAAARQVYDGPLIRFTGYDPMDDGSTNMTSLGEGFILECEMRVKVPEFIAPTTVLTTFQGDAIAELPAGDETYASWNQT